MSKPLTAAELAEMLGVTTRTIQRKARDREIPHQRVGRLIRFRQSDVEEIERMCRRDAIQRRPEADIPNPVYQPHAVVVPMRPDAA